MSKKILVDASYKEEVRVAVIENKKVQEYDYEFAARPQLKGNIYLAKITRVEPSLQAAFIDYGNEKHGFLPFSEIHPSYFNIPVSDRENVKKDLKDASDEIVDNFQAITPPDLSDIQDDEEINDASDIKDDNQEVLKSDIAEEKLVDHINNFEDEIEDESSEDKQHQIYLKYKIQEVIKKNQVILVQTTKEERGNKGASFTSFISLAGRYCVLMPNSNKQGGISRRIVDMQKRNRLKRIIDSLNLPEGVSVILRTAGEVRNKGEIKRDYDYLVRLWNNIREHTIAAKAPTFIHAESDVIKRAIRDVFDSNTSEIIVQGEEAFRTIRDFTKKLIPMGETRIKNYKEKTPLFHKYNIEEQISSLYGQIVTLESGGYLVINATEALTSIDVNSGRSTSERNIEETALKTNVEAAKEVAIQIKLRDISGLVVIDFIDMMDYHNRKTVERIFKDALKSDRARIQVSNISPFGLVEMSRQRLRSSFTDSRTVACSHCAGKGRVREAEINALIVLRTIENEICNGNFESVIVYAHIDVVLYILNSKREHIKNIEKKYNTKVRIQQEFNINVDSYSIERVPFGSTKVKDFSEGPTLDEEDIEIDDMANYESDDEDNFQNVEMRDITSHNPRSDAKDDKNNRFKKRIKNKNFKHNNYKKFGKRNFSNNNPSSPESLAEQKPDQKSGWWGKIFG